MKHTNPFFTGKSFYLAGVIEQEAGDYEKASDYLLKAMSVLFDSHPIESAIASTDLVITYLLQGDFDSAKRAAMDMVKFTVPFRGVVDIEEEILDLISMANLADGLDVEMVSVKQEKIDKSRARYWRSRLKDRSTTQSIRQVLDQDQNLTQCFL